MEKLDMHTVQYVEWPMKHSPTQKSNVSPMAFRQLFTGYELGESFDEMFDELAQPREHYLTLYERLRSLSPELMGGRQRAADIAFMNQGITFTVYGNDQGTERIFPYDLLPRIITGAEWSKIER